MFRGVVQHGSPKRRFPHLLLLLLLIRVVAVWLRTAEVDDARSRHLRKPAVQQLGHLRQVAARRRVRQLVLLLVREHPARAEVLGHRLLERFRVVVLLAHDAGGAAVDLVGREGILA
jgi:hypothetical protein